jgi:hypothetical protein
VRTIVGFLAILLGAVCFLATLALIGGAWWGARQAASHAGEVTAKADESLAELEGSVGRLREQFESYAASAATVARGASNATMTKAEAERLRNTLVPLLERADALRDALPAVAKLIDAAADAAEQTGSKSRSAGLRSAAGNVREAAAAIDTLGNQSATIRRGEPPTTLQLADAARRVQAPLELLAKGLADVERQAEGWRADLPKARQAVDDWKTSGPAILTGVLLVWAGLGQLCLIGWGRRRLARTPPATKPAA